MADAAEEARRVEFKSRQDSDAFDKAAEIEQDAAKKWLKSMRQNALRAHTEAAIAGAVANEFSCHKQTLQEKQKIKEQEWKEKMSKDMQLRDDVQEQEQKNSS